MIMYKIKYNKNGFNKIKVMSLLRMSEVDLLCVIRMFSLIFPRFPRVFLANIDRALECNPSFKNNNQFLIHVK